MKDVSLVIFDLDGTLIDAYEAIYRSFNHVMAEAGYPERPERVIRKAVGWGDRNLLKPFVSKRDLDRVLALYRSHHSRSLPRWSRLIPGARRVLSTLKKRGCALAVASNRPTRFSLILLRSCGIRKYFDAVLCGDRVKKGKPDPEILRKLMARLRTGPSETAYVGDMAIDVQAGKRAGVLSIAVTGGSSSQRELRKQRLDIIIRRIGEMTSVIKPCRSV
jgi:HAD superfamily hydrolase (TIGR01509 family)